jgi:hypothetical protein
LGLWLGKWQAVREGVMSMIAALVTALFVGVILGVWPDDRILRLLGWFVVVICVVVFLFEMV